MKAKSVVNNALWVPLPAQNAPPASSRSMKRRDHVFYYEHSLSAVRSSNPSLAGGDENSITSTMTADDTAKTTVKRKMILMKELLQQQQHQFQRQQTRKWDVVVVDDDDDDDDDGKISDDRVCGETENWQKGGIGNSSAPSQQLLSAENKSDTAAPTGTTKRNQPENTSVQFDLTRNIMHYYEQGSKMGRRRRPDQVGADNASTSCSCSSVDEGTSDTTRTDTTHEEGGVDDDENNTSTQLLWYTCQDYKRFKSNAMKTVQVVRNAQNWRAARDSTRRNPFSYSALIEHLHQVGMALEQEEEGSSQTRSCDSYSEALTLSEQKKLQRLYRTSLDIECVLGLERLLVPQIGIDRNDLHHCLMRTLDDLQDHYHYSAGSFNDLEETGTKNSSVLADNMCQISMEVSRSSRVLARYLAVALAGSDTDEEKSHNSKKKSSLLPERQKLLPSTKTTTTSNLSTASYSKPNGTFPDPIRSNNLIATTDFTNIECNTGYSSCHDDAREGSLKLDFGNDDHHQNPPQQSRPYMMKDICVPSRIRSSSPIKGQASRTFCQSSMDEEEKIAATINLPHKKTTTPSLRGMEQLVKPLTKEVW